jgi:hypothetical protein
MYGSGVRLSLELIADNLGARARQCPAHVQRPARSHKQRSKKRSFSFVTITIRYTTRLDSVPVYIVRF